MDEQHGAKPDPGALGVDDDKTAVIVRRLTREDVSKGVRHLAAACGGFRQRLYEGVEFLDDGTKAGLTEVTPAEAEDLDGDIDDMIAMLTGVKVALKRHINPPPTQDP